MYHKHVLPNGVRVVSEELPHVNSISLGIWVKAGSRNEGEGNNGVSHFLEHLLFKGTQKRTAKDIAEEMESVGGSLNAFTTKEYTCYYARALADHLDLALDLLSDMFFNSSMAVEELEKEKKIIKEEIRMYEDSPDELVHDLFARTVWDGHPLGRAILGSFDSLDKMTRDKITNYYQSRYNSHNTVIAVAGKLDDKSFLDRLSSYFDRLHQPNNEENDSNPQANSRTKIVTRETEQVQLCVGVPGLAQEDPDVYALNILNNVLGGGVSSRFFQKIREEKALAYSIFSYHATYSDTGLFTVYAGTSPETSIEVLGLILAEMALIKQKGITSLELSRAKEQIRGNLLLSLENVSNRMSRLGKTELCYNRVITVEEALENMLRVKIDDVGRVASRLFCPEKLSFTAIGPLEEELSIEELRERSGL